MNLTNHRNPTLTVLSTILVLFFTTTIYESCSKNEIVEATSELPVAKIPEPLFYIKFKAKPYRPIKNRPRDNKECDCKTCLGVCDILVWIEPSKPTFYLVPDNLDEGVGTGRMYLIDTSTTYTDPEFGIDSLLIVDGNRGSDSLLFDEVHLLVDEYTFVQHSDTLIWDGDTSYSLGYADIDINKIK